MTNIAYITYNTNITRATTEITYNTLLFLLRLR